MLNEVDEKEAPKQAGKQTQWTEPIVVLMRSNSELTLEYLLTPTTKAPATPYSAWGLA
jgi:hypothetical protein